MLLLKPLNPVSLAASKQETLKKDPSLCLGVDEGLGILGLGF